jgi:hypothetical protein
LVSATVVGVAASAAAGAKKMTAADIRTVTELMPIGYFVIPTCVNIQAYSNAWSFIRS